MFSIRKRQKEECKKMLSLGYTPDKNEYWENLWKVLVCDSFCRDLLAPLFSFDELQKLGVTLLMSINTPRQPIPDVNAIYFVQAEKENLNRICEDCATGVYDKYYLSFVSHLPQKDMEDLARNCIAKDCVSSITKVTEQHTNFISLEDTLFTLNQHNSYVAFNNPVISDAEATENVEKTVDGLFSAIVTLGKVPIIRCPKGSASEIVAKRLYERIHAELASVPNLFTESASSIGGLGTGAGSSFQRPVLLILDRNVDLTVMLSHSWTYQALCHDVFGMFLNRLKVDVKEKDGVEKKIYDFQDNDPFWVANAGSPFPNVLVSIRQQVDEYEVKVKKNNQGDEQSLFGGGEDFEGSISRNIQDKISQIPELTRQKELLAMHTNIAAALLEQINLRNMDEFFRLEEDLMSNATQSLDQKLLKLIDEEKGTPEDKLRIFLIYYLIHSRTITNDELSIFKSKLKAVGCDLSTLSYLQEIKAFNDTWTSTQAAAQPKRDDWLNMFSSIVSKGVQYLVPANKNYHVTRIMEAIMDLKETKEVKEYLYFDPKFPLNSTPRKNTPFKEGIVFIIGGGNYLEYQNLRDFVQKQANPQDLSLASVEKQIIYGSTEICTGPEFLKQLGSLGHSILD